MVRGGDGRRRCVKHEPETDNNYLLRWKQELKRDRRTALPIYIKRNKYIYIYAYNKGTFIFSRVSPRHVYTHAFCSDQPCGSTAFLNIV